MHKFIYVAATTLFTGSVSLLSAGDFADSVRGSEEELRFEDVFAAASLITDNLRQDDSERESVVSVEEKSDVEDQDLSLVEPIGGIPILTPQKVVPDSTSVADLFAPSSVERKSIGDALGAAYMKEKLRKDELARQQLKEEEKKAAEERRVRRLSLGSDLQDYETLVEQLLANNLIAGKTGVTLSIKFASGLEAKVNERSEVEKVVPEISSPVKQRRKSNSFGNSSSRSGSDSGSDTDDGTHQIVLNVPL